MTQLLGTKAAIVWTSTADSNAERVHLLAVPLRLSVPAKSRWVGRAESLDRTVIEAVTVGSGAHEFIGTVRFDDDPQSLIDLLNAGNANTTLTYIPNLTDPGVTHACKLISPAGNDLQVALDQARATFGNVSVEIRLRRTDQAPFASQYQGTNVLFWYRGGGSLENYTFTRATTATRIDKGRGTYAVVSSGKAATGWVDIDGDGYRESPALALSPARTNLCLQSENFGTTWTTSGTPTRSAAAKSCGTLSLDLIGDDSAAALEAYLQTVAFTGDGVKAVSLHVAQSTSTTSLLQLRDVTASANRLFAVVTWSNGVPSVSATTGTFLGQVSLDDGVYRLYFSTTSITAANTNSMQVYPACDAAASVALTGDVYAGGVQCENATYPGPYIPTTTTTVTRNADVVSATFGARPQALTVYVRFMEMGNVHQVTTNNRVIQISSSNPRLCVVWNSTNYALFRSNAAGTGISSAATVNPVLGDIVELVGVLNADGSVQLIQAINNGSPATSAASSAMKLDAAWGNTNIYLGSEAGAVVGSLDLINAVVVRGVQSLDAMRRIAKI